MRDKCGMCGDKIFKIIDGKIMCRKGHLVGMFQALPKAPPIKTGKQENKPNGVQ